MMRKVLPVLLAMFIIVAPATAITLDNSGGGTWAASVQFLTTDVASEDAQYKIVINGTTLEIYNALEELEITKSISDFWSLVDVNGTDIRVYNQSDQLYFWIEEWDYANQKAVIWVRLEAGSTELNIAYGNPSATKSDYENGEQVFEFFDDFEGSSKLDITTSESTSYEFSTLDSKSGQYSLRYIETSTTAGGSVKGLSSYNNPFVAEAWVKPSFDDTVKEQLIMLAVNDSVFAGFRNAGADNDPRLAIEGASGDIEYKSTINWEQNKWYRLRVIVDDNGYVTIELYNEDGTLFDSYQSTSTYTPTHIGFYIYTGGSQTGDAFIDALKVLKLADPADFTVPTTGGYTGFDNANGGAWSQYISIPITTTPSEYAQYKVEINGNTITIYNVTGAVEINGTVSGFWDNVQPDGDDIRVFNQNFEQLYFWIEKWDYANQKAVIWVRLEAGSTELNIAYGNPSALPSTYMNGTKTFEFFDDFNDNDISDYTIALGVFDANNGYMHASPDYSENWAYHSTATISTPALIRFKVWTSSGHDTGVVFGMQNTSNTYFVRISDAEDAIHVYERKDGTWTKLSSVSVAIAPSQWYVEEALWKNANDIEARLYDLDGNLLATTSVTATAGYSSGYIGVRSWYDGGVDDIIVAKLADPADFGTPLVKLFQKKFGTKTVYVNVTYLDTNTTERYNPTAYYNLEDVPQINVTSSLPISGVNTTFGAEISIELINFVTLDKVTYNGTEVSVNYQGTITNSTTGLTYNVYKFTTYENGTLEIYGHVGNKAYEATYKLDGDIVDISNVSAIIGEVLDVSLPHRAKVLVGRYLFDNVTTLSLNTLNLKIGNNLLQITIDDPENFTVGYTRKEFKVIWGFVDLNITGYENKSFTGYTVAVLNKRYSLLTTSPGRLYAGENEISIFFHGIKLKSVNVVVSHSNNGYEVNVSVNATKIHDYRGVDKIIASPNSFEIVNLSPKYPFAVMRLINASGEVVIDYGSNAPTSVEVTGDVASYSYEKPVLKLVAAGNVTVADLYKVTEPLKDRLGNPVNFHVSFDGVTAPASNGIAAKLLKPDVYSVTVPTNVLGFRYYRLISSANLVPVPSGREAEGVYVKYITSTPPSGWNTELLFNDSGWSIGRTPICDKTTCPTYVDLNGGHLYVRYAFNLSKIIRNHYAALNLSEWNITIEKATVYCKVDDECWVWLNGEQVLYAKLSANKWDGQADVTKYLDLEENLLAIHLWDSHGGSNYLDFKLEATIKLTKLNNSFTINVSKDLNLPLAEYRVPTRFETNEVKIERFKLPFPLPIPFLPFSEPQEDEKVYMLVRLEGTLKDYYGAPVPNREVRIIISSPNVTRVFNTTTDESGNFFIETDFAKGIEYTVKYGFIGDDVYVESSTTKTFYPGELPVAPAPPAPAELTLIVVVVAAVAAMIVAAVFIVRRTRATARAKIESEFRFFRRIR